MKKFLFCLLVTIIISPKVKCQENQAINKQLYLENYLAAKRMLLASTANPTSAKADDLCALGRLYLRFNQIDSAKYCYDQALKLNPKSIFAYAGLTKISILSGDAKGADVYLDDIYKIDKNKNANVFIEVAESYFTPKKKNYLQVMKYLDKAKSIDKAIPEIYITKGDYFLNCDSAGKAANEYERALTFEEKNIKAQTRIGWIFSLSKNFIEAQKAYIKALQIDSMYAPALRQLSDLYYSKGMYSKALPLYKNLMMVSEYDLNQQLRYATLLFQNKAYDEALVACERAMADDSKNLVAKRIKSYTLFELKKYSEGIALIQDVVNRKDTENIMQLDYEYYAKLLSQNDKDSLGLIYFFKVLKADTSKKDLYDPIAKSYDKLKKYDKAIEYYEKLIASKTASTATDYFMLARSCYNEGNSLTNVADSAIKLKYYIKADTSFAMVISKSPLSHLGYFWRARVNTLLDPETEKGLAKPFYEKADSIMNTNPTKFKRELVETYQYLGYYYYLKGDRDKESSKLFKEDNENSKLYWNKLLAIDPENSKAKEALKGIK